MKKDNNLIIFGIAGLILIIFLFNGGLKININMPSSNDSFSSVSPEQGQEVYGSCYEVCYNNGFSKSYNFVNQCKLGETKITYGYPNQVPLLVCCCYNEQVSSGTCTETDGGNVNTIPSTTVSGGVGYMDYCFDSTTVYEYWCLSDGTWQGGKSDCGNGEICLSSRSGGYCKAKSWNAGDTVTSGSGSGSLTGVQEGFAEIDLSQYGIGTDGNCRLGVQLQTSWSYGNDKCVGLQGAEGMKWDFYDSNGLEYSRIDSSPVSLGVDLHPETHILNWDGHTKWRAYAKQYPFVFPDCIINYEYTARIYIYDCV